jgi:Holliday junction resolvase RusA-like endonuclease
LVAADSLIVTVLDPPRGKGRPRFGNGRAFTDAATVHAESAVRKAWQEQGAVQLPEGMALAIQVLAYLARPKGHYRANGQLSAAGLRQPYPTKAPDWDNIAKLIGDALQDYAYRADAAIVSAAVRKRWCEPGDIGPRTVVMVWVVVE